MTNYTRYHKSVKKPALCCISPTRKVWLACICKFQNNETQKCYGTISKSLRDIWRKHLRLRKYPYLVHCVTISWCSYIRVMWQFSKCDVYFLGYLFNSCVEWILSYTKLSKVILFDRFIKLLGLIQYDQNDGKETDFVWVQNDLKCYLFKLSFCQWTKWETKQDSLSKLVIVWIEYRGIKFLKFHPLPTPIMFS